MALLLHGYGLGGEDVLSTVSEALPQDWPLLAPNAPYPFYSSKQKKLVYSWYFYDMEKNLFVIDMSVALSLLGQILKPYVEAKRPIYILGYSQGAYLAPYVGLEGDIHPEKVIVLNGRLRHEDLVTSKVKFPVLALHGDADEVVDVKRCLESIELMKKAGWQVDLHLVKGSAHELDSALRDELKRAL